MSAYELLFDGEGFVAATLRAAKSGSDRKRLQLENGSTVERWANGVICITPAQQLENSRDLILSCGVHGNETAPIELLERLCEAILAEEIVVRQRVLFLFANPMAARKQERYLEHNMNRLFSGAHAGAGIAKSWEGARAAAIEAYVTEFFGESKNPVHYDLHTAIRPSRHRKFAIYPWLQGRSRSLSQLGFLERCGIEAVLLSQQPSGTFSYFTSNAFAADAFTLELGSVHPFGENDLRRYKDLYRCLVDLIEGREHWQARPENLIGYRVQHEFIKQSEALRFGFSDATPNFTEFAAGTLLAEDGAQRYVTQLPGECIVFPNRQVPAGERALLIVSPIELARE